ncbi:MAG: DUF2461 domain-containing protein [Phycisphaerales bacterium]|nr:DUF2461 domain-containing protein [Phycisphaerales bacterium]NNM24782.1 DUF2461 domain-containing protein [Phycisphaerales bacterium]
MPGHRYFRPQTFAFLRDLKQHNDRGWFHENKPRYEQHVREPALRFITDFGLELKRISRHFVADARASGGSLFRIHRDIRFSADKSPYKTSSGIQFRHVDGKDAHAPGYYLHLEPGMVFAGVGIWHPDGPTLGRIRDAIVAKPTAWTRARDDTGFTAQFTLAGESLKRPPRGYPADHPLVEDLKRKDFIAVAKLTQGAVTGTDLLERFAELCRVATPWQRYLCGAVGVKF